MTAPRMNAPAAPVRGAARPMSRRTARLLLLATMIAWLALPGLAAAASPTPSPVTGGDTRSPGEGPGFVGSPGVAIGAVLVIGVVTVVGTLAYVRFTGGPGGASR